MHYNLNDFLIYYWNHALIFSCGNLLAFISAGARYNNSIYEHPNSPPSKVCHHKFIISKKKKHLKNYIYSLKLTAMQLI